MLTLECEVGSSNPKASIFWRLGALRFGKAVGGEARGRQWHMLIGAFSCKSIWLIQCQREFQWLMFILLNVAICMISWKTWTPPLIGFSEWDFCPRFQGVEQSPTTAKFGGVSVRSSLSLNLSSQHHNQRVICQAYSPVLEEGAYTFFKLHVLCK